MCGIAGIISKTKEDLIPDEIRRFEKSTLLMAHRGPDNFGKYIERKIAMYHYRLSVIDLKSRSNQPFKINNGKLVTVYNGEIYNYKELAIQNNISTSTTSDTEVAVKSFSENGINAIKNWNGIFALCIYDIEAQLVTLSRDRFGIKPLYYFEDEHYFVFASEAKVIFNWLSQFEISYQ